MVTITGTGLTGATAVKFGTENAAGFTVESDTVVKAESPTACTSGTVDVTVTTPSGTSPTSSVDHFTCELPVPTVTEVLPNHGTPETSVTIKGTNLAGASAVHFGTEAAAGTITVNGAGTEITGVKSPAGCTSGTVDVTVTTGGGTSPTTAADHFTCVPPAPTVTGISSEEGSTAGGELITIIGTNLGFSLAKVEFGGTAVTCPKASAPGKCVGKSATEVEVEVPGHAAGTVHVTVTTGGGTSATSSADEYTYIGSPAVTAVSPARGSTAGGNMVLIRGMRLEGATRVEFGSIEAPIVEITAGAIKAIAPSHAAGAIDVRVTTLGGISGKFAADEYVYVGAQPLTVGTAGSGSGSVTCNGGACAPSYAFGSTVTLAASAASGSNFSGFSGACSGTGSCTVTLEGPTAVTATFDKKPQESPPPPSAAKICSVPRLKGKSLGAAKSALKAADCATGKVTKPEKNKGALVVKSSSPGADKTVAAGTKVDLKLGPKPKKEKK
jgi:hypothetical protein